MQRDKIETFLGFSVKSGALVYGTDNIKQSKKKLYLIIICSTLSENSRKEIFFSANKKSIPVLIALKPLSEIIHKQGCKAVALTDMGLAEAVKQNVNHNFKLIERTSEETN